MDFQSAIARLEGALSQQLLLAGTDPAVEEAGRALMAVLEPSIKELTLELAGAAAAEVQSQLPDHRVEVVIEGGEPRISLRPLEPSTRFGPSDYEARVTVRLPDALKALIDDAAEDAGDSVNSWIVNALSSKTSRRTGKNVSGTFDL